MKINGKESVLERDITLNTLLEQMNYDIKKIAVMKNGEIIPKEQYSAEIISNSDSLEVVSFVGGG